MSDLVCMAGIDKHFPGVHALRQVHFDLKSGEVHALMGENGAGKSTLMKVLSGIYQPDAGTIEIDGQAVEVSGPRAAQQLGIGIIHQELSLMNDLNVAQNIMIGREPRKLFGRIDEAELNRRAAASLEAIHMPIDPRTPVAGLSIARQQMIEIAKALSNRTRIMIMDEPTAALTDSEINELFSIIRGLRAEGVGIVYISHKLDELKRIADRVTVMRDGEYVGTVDAAETPVPTIISMMVGRALTDEAVKVPDLKSAETALEVRNLTRGRDIKDVSFTLKRGEVLGFAGLMGAGRTEVARAIFGADPRDGGELIVNGKAMDIRSPKQAVRAGIGYLSEDRKQYGLALPMDVRANVGMATLDRYSDRIGRIDESGLAGAVANYIRSLVIRTPSDRQETQYLSGGNQQKVVMAKWLLRDCDILIFDEPTRGIDVGAKAEIYRLLAKLAEQGKALIVISSELPEVLRVSHRIAVMCEGRLTGILPGGAETTQEQIMHLATQRDTSSKEQAA